MAAAFQMSRVAAQAALDAFLALLNAGTPPGQIKIYSGSAPANLETAASGTLLATLNLSNTAFPASAAVTSPDRGATATANAITTANAVATNTAGYFRACNAAGTAVIQGTVGTSSADLVLNSTSLVSGAPVSVTSWTVHQPDGA